MPDRHRPEPASSPEGISSSRAVANAALVGAGFGLLEAIVRLVGRSFPALHAAYQVPRDVLWAAPAVDALTASLAVAGVLVMLRFAPRRWQPSSARASLTLATTVGAAGAFMAIGVLHWASASVLGLGVGSVVWRRAGRPEGPRSMPVAPALAGIAILILGGLAASRTIDWAEERSFARSLPAPTQAMNLLVVVMDTVRADRALTGTDASLTPRLDALARQGVRFERAWGASSWSLPSQATLMTGVAPGLHHADWPSFQLAADRPTLASHLAERGYATGAFSGNSAWITPEYVGRGFLRFHAYNAELLLRRTSFGRFADRASWEFGLHSAGRGRRAEDINAEILGFVRDYPGRPFFAYACYMDVNQDFHRRRYERNPRHKASTTAVVQAYDDGLRRLDARIGELLEGLDRQGVLSNTVVVVTSDHGESFGPQNGDHDPLGHGTSLYTEQLRVPLAIWSPDMHAGTTVTDAVGNDRIAATALALMGIDHRPFGASALDTAHAIDHGFARSSLRYDGADAESVAFGSWQLLRGRRKPHLGEALYDLSGRQAAPTDLGRVDLDVLERARRLLARGDDDRVPTAASR